MHVRFRPFVSTLVIAVAVGSQVPAAQSGADKRPMTFLDMQQMRNAGSPAPSPDGKWLLYTAVDAGLEGSQAPDRHRPGLAAAGCQLDEAADLHEREERDIAAVGQGRHVVLLPLEPRGARERRVAQPGLSDAHRRRRSPARDRREGRRVQLHAEPGRQVAGVSQRQVG